MYVGFALRAGRIAGRQLRKVADLADEFGAGRIRTTTQQKMVVLDVPPRRVDGLVAGLADEDLQVRPSPFRAGLMACTGIEFCKLAITETKGRAIWLARELEERGYPDHSLEALRHASRLDPADLPLKEQLARGFIARGDLTKAAEYLTAEIAGTDPELQNRRRCDVRGGPGRLFLQLRIGRDLREHVLEVRLGVPVPLRHGATLRLAS